VVVRLAINRVNEGNKMKSIENLRQLFFNAYANASFDPEKRTEADIQAFSQELEADLQELGSTNNYEAKYLKHLSLWLARKARVLSWMITGPANFPVARNQKACASTDKAWQEFRAWRKRYIKRANSVRTKSPEEEIDLVLAELDKEKTFHEMLLIVSKILRNKIMSEQEKIDSIKLNTTFTDENILDWFKNGFPSYQIAYSNTRIKRFADKLKVMRSRVARKESFEPIVFDGGTITIENDRVCVRHDSKPEKEVRLTLGKSGFHWSSHWSCWCRKHTLQAIMDAKRITGVCK